MNDRNYIYIIIRKFEIKLPWEKVSLWTDNLTGLVPHTISSHLDISKFKNKVIYLDLDQNAAENEANMELPDKHLTLINHCFESPGYYNVRLSSKGKAPASGSGLF
jgi:hypothetical protein